VTREQKEWWYRFWLAALAREPEHAQDLRRFVRRKWLEGRTYAALWGLLPRKKI
jgi:hypothetical protein